MEGNEWRQCVACKKPILLGAKYYSCSVTSCNPKHAPTQFCSFECWAAHNEIYRHRNAAAVEETAPSQPDAPHDGGKEKRPPPKPRESAPTSTSASARTEEQEILVVVSKIKKYIHDESGFNASADLMPALTDILLRYCDTAVVNARQSGRKTVMARDLPK